MFVWYVDSTVCTYQGSYQVRCTYLQITVCSVISFFINFKKRLAFLSRVIDDATVLSLNFSLEERGGLCLSLGPMSFAR